MGKELSKETVNKVLEYLKTRKCITTNELEKVFEMSRGEGELILGLLLSQGIISEVKELSSCSTCPLASGCILKYGYNMRIYRVGKMMN